MKKQIHVLNGDALMDQIQGTIEGEFVIIRECLVDGDVGGSKFSQFFDSRARFISENYKGFKFEDYFEKTVPELKKIQNIQTDSEINLWFEEDLFCQVNLWFVIFLIFENYKNQDIYLIRPAAHCRFNFAAMNKGELSSRFEHRQRIELIELMELSKLWNLYQQDDHDGMLRIAEKLNDEFPFLIPVIKAHKDRLPFAGDRGRPANTLIQIMNELNTKEFGPIFKEFTKREGIYGFGDLQVERILNDLKTNC